MRGCYYEMRENPSVQQNDWMTDVHRGLQFLQAAPDADKPIFIDEWAKQR